MPGKEGTLLMENAQIIFRNFSGRAGPFNEEGDRGFCVLLEPELAEQMVEDGWNVKTLRAREEEDEPQPYIQVSLKYRDKKGDPVRPPTVVMITSKGRSNIPEDALEILDWVDIAKSDVIIRPYDWAFAGKSGRKAYVKSVYITAEEDYLELKYADLPEIGASGAVLELNAGSSDSDVIDAESWEVEDALELLPARSGSVDE